jgi:8-oxo-dGTP pyrophosphatase MutT (NUDIX family)
MENSQTGHASDRHAAGALLIAEDTGRVLLAQRSQLVDRPGLWALPGGGVEPGETPAEGALRELWEEVGWDGPVELYPAGTRRASRGGATYHSFLGLVPTEFEPVLNWESSDAGWFDPEDLPSPIHPEVAPLVQRELGRIRSLSSGAPPAEALLRRLVRAELSGQ